MQEPAGERGRLMVNIPIVADVAVALQFWAYLFDRAACFTFDAYRAACF